MLLLNNDQSPFHILFLESVLLEQNVKHRFRYLFIIISYLLKAN